MLNKESNHIYSESDLITGCIEGDPKYQKELYDRFAAKMYGVCLRYAGNINDANDLLQEGFIKVLTNISRFRGEGSFEGWIRRIFINTCIEQFRKKIKSYNLTEAHENIAGDNDLDAMDHLAVKDLMNIVNELPLGYKTIFNLYVVEGFSHKEIADMLNISEGTSKSQLARAKGSLKKLLEIKYKKADR